MRRKRTRGLRDGARLLQHDRCGVDRPRERERGLADQLAKGAKGKKLRQAARQSG